VGLGEGRKQWSKVVRMYMKGWTCGVEAGDGKHCLESRSLMGCFCDVAAVPLVHNHMSQLKGTCFGHVLCRNAGSNMSNGTANVNTHMSDSIAHIE
jgi:hypothetical protein